MGSSKKGAVVLVKLVSSAGTGVIYYVKKNSRKLTNKLVFRKYDKKIRKHVEFIEKK